MLTDGSLLNKILYTGLSQSATQSVVIFQLSVLQCGLFELSLPLESYNSEFQCG